MKILTPGEMRAADNATFNRVGVPSRAVMESAGRAVVDLLVSEIFPKHPSLSAKPVLVVAGKGNNGGDGYVAARLLHNLGIAVQLVGTSPVNELSGEARSAAEAWLNSTTGKENANAAEVVDSLASASGVVIDAIYGTGFHPPMDPISESFIRAINKAGSSGCFVLAIDIPSGITSELKRSSSDNLSCNSSSEVCIDATATVALQCLKLGHLAAMCGEVYVADIGIDTRGPEVAGVSREILVQEVIARLLRKRFFTDSERHKGDKGHVAILGGSAGHWGAPKMSGIGALRAGAGLATVLLPQSGASNLGRELIELMCIGVGSADSAGEFSDSSVAEVLKGLEKKNVLVMGPGLGTTAGSKRVLEAALEYARGADLPTVMDADALNLLAMDRTLYKRLPKSVVLTPHPGEMARLVNAEVKSVQNSRIECAQKLAEQSGAVAVLKGAHTIIATPAEGSVSATVYINPTATEVLGTAGSGDVLSGIIGGFLARGYSTAEASCLGVFTHGAAGELLEGRGGLGVLASDIAEALPEVLNLLHRLPLDPIRLIRKILPGALQRTGYGQR